VPIWKTIRCDKFPLRSAENTLCLCPESNRCPALPPAAKKRFATICTQLYAHCAPKPLGLRVSLLQEGHAAHHRTPA